MLKVLLVASDEAHRAEVKAALAALGEPPLQVIETTFEQAANLKVTANGNGNGNGNGAGLADVAMVVFNGDDESALSYLEAQAKRDPRPVLFALCQERSPDLMRRVLRRGADEVLFLPLDAGDATRALLKISETRRREERHEGGTVCSMVSLMGGIGMTSLAANLALALKYTLDKRVAVVDLDLQTSALSVFLNIEADRTVMALAESERKLDSLQLESALSKHGSGIYLLAAPKRIEDSELISDATVVAAIDLMRQLFDYIIIDCGTHIDGTKVAAWEHSQHLIYGLDQSIGAARCAWRFVDLCGRLGLGEVEPKFILNRFVANHPISEEQLSHTLARPIYAKIPRDDKLLERVQLSAQDLWQIAPNSTVARSVEDFARRLDGCAPAESPRESSIMSRLLGAIGRG
jgi:pilus assembly protein CpaE